MSNTPESMRQVLVTGATGFVGRSLCTYLLSRGYFVRGTLLQGEMPSSLVSGVEPTPVAPLGPETLWERALVGIDTIMHLAARVHVMRETEQDPLAEFSKVNTDGTINLARQAALAGVKRFVFMSTIGVNGACSGDTPFTEMDTPQPHNPYAQSKHAAEQALRNISTAMGMEVVIVRAPLVYGPANPGNFLSLMKAVHRGLPLPLAAIANKRSLVYVENLVNVLVMCAVHTAAVGNTYLVSDGEDVSTPELIRRTAAALGVSARLFPLPVALMQLAGVLAGKRAAINQLIGSLQVDSSRVRWELGWQPPCTMEEGLRFTAEWFLQDQGSVC